MKSTEIISTGFLVWEEEADSLPSELLLPGGVYITGFRLETMDLLFTLLSSLDNVAHRPDTYVVPAAGIYCLRSALIEALTLGFPIAPEEGFVPVDCTLERGLHFDRLMREGNNDMLAQLTHLSGLIGRLPL